MIPDTVKFWFYLIFLIPSILCLLFILYHFWFDRTLRHSLNNHVIILLLVIILIGEITIYPWMLYFYQYKGVWERSHIFCTIWGALDWGFYVTQTILFAWATIERHILIFHDKWVSTKKKRFFVHYLPPIILLLYCLIFYIVVFFFPPCQNFFNLSYAVCVFPCLYLIYELSVWDSIAHEILPVLIIVVFSIALLVRVVWQKHRMHQPVQWRKYRKMTIQLLSVSFLYLIFYLPYMLIYIMSLAGVPQTDTFYDFYMYTTFFIYFLFLLFPFVCALSLPELRTKLIKIFHLQRQPRRIDPEI